MSDEELLRFDKMDNTLDEVLIRLERIDNRMERHADTIAALVAEVGGVQDVTTRRNRPTMRDRIHSIESDRAAARITAKAIEQMQKRSRQSWSVREKVALFAIAAGGLAVSALRLIGVGG